MEQENKRPQIPFVKPERVGNFKLWRSKTSLSYAPTDEDRAKVREESGGKKKAVTRKVDIEVINISNLDGSWKVQIPQTMQMFGTISEGFAVEDTTRRDQFLGSVIGSIYNASTNSSVYFHDSLAILTEMLTFPYMLLPEKEMVKRMKAVYKVTGFDKKVADKQIEDMVSYRRKLYELIEKKKSDYIEEYDRQQVERRAKEDESLKALEQDEIADQAVKTINNEGVEQ